MNNMTPIAAIPMPSPVVASIPQRPMPASRPASTQRGELGGPAAEEVFSARPVSYPEPETGVSQRIDTSQHDEEQFDREEAQATGDAALRMVTKEGPTKAMERLAEGDIFFEDDEETFVSSKPEAATKEKFVDREPIHDPLGILSSKENKEAQQDLATSLQREVDRLGSENKEMRDQLKTMHEQIVQTTALTREVVQAMILYMQEMAEKAKKEKDDETAMHMTRFVEWLIRALTGDPKAIEQTGDPSMMPKAA